MPSSQGVYKPGLCFSPGHRIQPACPVPSCLAPIYPFVHTTSSPTTALSLSPLSLSPDPHRRLVILRTMSDSKSATAVMQKSPNGTGDGSKATVSAQIRHPPATAPSLLTRTPTPQPGGSTSSTTDGAANGAGPDQATSPYMMAAPVPGGLSPPPYHYKRRK